MSVLSIPRIYFKGSASWDPATANNNDQWQTFDTVHATLDWECLALQRPAITPDNARTMFPRWAQTLQYFAGRRAGWYQPPAEWNYYGTNEAWLHSESSQTIVTGAQLGYDEEVVTSGDAVVGAYVSVVGDPYPDMTFPTAPRFTDVNPNSFWSTCIFVRELHIGDTLSPSVYFSGEVAPGTFMSSHWLNLERNLNVDGQLEIAGVGGAVFQAAIPKHQISRLDSRRSDLLKHVEEALGRKGAKGLMVRLSAHMTRYFTAEAFSGCKGMTEKYTRLVQLWDDALATGKTPPRNPAVSEVVGTLGLWFEGEPASSPAGRYLIPRARIPISTPAVADEPLAPALGPAVVEVHADEGFVSLDLLGAIPEFDSSRCKADLGTLALVLVDGGGRETTLAVLSPTDYDQAQYEGKAGIVDVALPDGVDHEQLARGTLRLVAQTRSRVVAMEETPFTVLCDARGLWVDEGHTETFTVQVRQNGAPPVDTVHVRLAQYLPHPPAPAPDPECWVLPSDGQPPVLEFVDPPNNVLTLYPSHGGVGAVTFRTLRPGFASIVFLPHRDGPSTPKDPPPRVLPFLRDPDSPLTTTSAFYCSVRAMPFDNDLPPSFADLWNNSHDDAEAWRFVYEKVLALYDVLYPAMRAYGKLDLGDRTSVERNIGLIVRLVDAPLTSSVRMPVTRDLSAGKRAVLRMYEALVKSDWPHQPDLEVPTPFPGSGLRGTP